MQRITVILLLVSPCTYAGNINFDGKKIVVGSLFLLTGDTSSISQTVIKGITSSSTVTFANGEDSTSVLIGLTITGGSGGIYCGNSSPRIAFSSIIGNAPSNFGGGICCVKANPILSHLTITNNSAYFTGGGIGCEYSNPVLSQSVVTNNTANVDGGGIWCDYSSPTLDGVVVSGNISENGEGGGLYFFRGSPGMIRSTTITNNVASWFGGGIACEYSSPFLDMCVISGNDAHSWYGGGIYCDSSMPTISNVLITNNKVDESVGVGSGGGGISCVDSSNPALSNVTVAENTAAVAGGGIYVDDFSTITFDSARRCNIYLNEAGVGNDIYNNGNVIHVVVDTFTVLNPTNDQAFPINAYSFDILHGKVSQNQSVLYVSPSGSNGNSGTPPDAPLQTIGFAKSIIQGTYQKQATIYLAPGTYSRETNGEHFELDLMNYLTLKGSGAGKTIIKGDGQDGVLFYSSTTRDTVEDLTIKNGGYGLVGEYI